jgi:DNA-binding winged helix-turn-helix (wHTH) protein
MRFGVFELDFEAQVLRKSGRIVRLQPQPFKLLTLLAQEAPRLVTREEIRAALWKDDTFVDFDQGVNFAVRQVRDALGDDAESPRYVETVHKRGYRFLVPVELTDQSGGAVAGTDLRLHKALWANIAELRLADQQRQQKQRVLVLVIAGLVIVIAALILSRFW